MPIKLYIYIAIVMAVIALAAWGRGIYNDYQSLKLERDKLRQNELAIRDSLEQKADSLTKTTAFVRELNTKLDDKDGQYTALHAQFSAYIESVHAHGTTVPIVNDSNITIPFSGKSEIVDYTGYTFYDLHTHDARWDLTITFPRPILIATDLIEEEGIWKFNSWTSTPGVKIKSTGILDNDTYRRLQKYAPPEPQKRFLIGAIVGQYGGPAVGYNADNWTILGFYSLINSNDDIYRNINIGVLWHPF